MLGCIARRSASSCMFKRLTTPRSSCPQHTRVDTLMRQDLRVMMRPSPRDCVLGIALLAFKTCHLGTNGHVVTVSLFPCSSLHRPRLVHYFDSDSWLVHRVLLLFVFLAIIFRQWLGGCQRFGGREASDGPNSSIAICRMFGHYLHSGQWSSCDFAFAVVVDQRHWGIRLALGSLDRLDSVYYDWMGTVHGCKFNNQRFTERRSPVISVFCEFLTRL
jgi:hypothetical protein